jgi:hypothetical protein
MALAMNLLGSDSVRKVVLVMQMYYAMPLQLQMKQ